MREWNADAYHRVSDPQLAWGLAVLGRLRFIGHERVLDVGCGTGRLTEHLAWRLPRGRVIAVDLSAPMLAAARSYLEPLVGRRVVFARADASALPFRDAVDAVFSTATFHWVPDHERLFRSLLAALKPGGRLVAQCGGGPNLARMLERCGELIASPPFERYFAGWEAPWLCADAASTARRLADAGFVAVDTSEQYAPVALPSAEAFRDFITHVICQPYLARIADPELQSRFIDLLVEQYAGDHPAFELDYWRLNVAGRRRQL